MRSQNMTGLYSTTLQTYLLPGKRTVKKSLQAIVFERAFIDKLLQFTQSSQRRYPAAQAHFQAERVVDPSLL